MSKLLILIVLSLSACSNKESAASQEHAPKSSKTETAKAECKPGETGVPLWVSYSGGSPIQQGEFRKCSSDGKWVHDPEAEKAYEAEQEKARAAAAKEEAHRKSLEWALRTRVLTDNEMKEVEKYGEALVCPYNWASAAWSNGLGFTATVSGNSEPSCTKILNDDLFQQMRLRAIQNGKMEREPKKETP